MIPVLLRVIDQSNIKVKVSAIDCICQVLFIAVEYYSNGTHLRNTMQKLVPFLSDKTNEVKRSSTDLMTKLYHMNSANFLTQLLVLPMTSQVYLLCAY